MSVKADKILKFYKIQNTGWSGGVSWFTCMNDKRFDTFEQAKEAYEDSRWDDDSVLWRFVEVTIFTYFQDETKPSLVTQCITQERYLYVN